ncbi:hypothetical protein HDU76_012689, partial [Blyttiomyces sp. JEL0837]
MTPYVVSNTTTTTTSALATSASTADQHAVVDPVMLNEDIEMNVHSIDQTVDISKNDDGVIRDRYGNIMDGSMTKDPEIRKWALIVLIILVISWTAQWTGFSLPYWRSDKYHSGGLFQVCGNYDWNFDPLAKNGAGMPIPVDRGYYKCQTVHDYVHDFLDLTCSYKLENVSRGSDHWCDEAKYAEGSIAVSRWFEATSTTMSMIFGTTTLWLVVFPDKDPKIASRNGVFALIGIFLTPWLCVIDFFISINYWDTIAVGYFERDGNNFLAAAAQLLVACTFVDLVVQYSFLRWGVLRHAWKVPGTTIAGMGGNRAA